MTLAKKAYRIGVIPFCSCVLLQVASSVLPGSDLVFTIDTQFAITGIGCGDYQHLCVELAKADNPQPDFIFNQEGGGQPVIVCQQLPCRGKVMRGSVIYVFVYPVAPRPLHCKNKFVPLHGPLKNNIQDNLKRIYSHTTLVVYGTGARNILDDNGKDITSAFVDRQSINSFTVSLLVKKTESSYFSLKSHMYAAFSFKST